MNNLVEDGYFDRNQNGSDCALVSLANAFHYHTGDKVYADTMKSLSETCGCTHGACVTTRPAQDLLKLEIGDNYKTLFDLPRVWPLPLELLVWHPAYGFHSVLVVAQDLKSQAVRVCNFRRETTALGWMFREKLNVYAKGVPANGWVARTWVERDKNEVYMGN